jgi:hypothetical protein
VTDTRSPELIAAERELLIHMGRAEEAMAKRDALVAAKPSAYHKAVTASGAPASSAARMAATHGRATPSPNATTTMSAPAPLVAASAAAGVNPGDVIGDRDTLARVMADTLQGAQRTDPPVGPRIVARRRWSDSYPEQRRLTLNDAQGNYDKVAAVCAPAAILASGGVALPVNVDYSVPTWADSNRPLRDALPAFQADRGGLRFVSPPDIGVPSLQGTASGLGSATGIWTEATDASPAGQTKPVYAVSVGTEQLVYVNAIPTRLGFGNMQGRFAPEQLAANTDLGIAVAAREAELELLTLMLNASKQVQPKEMLGASRDVLASLDLLLAQYRYSHRIPRNAAFDAVFPEWAVDLIRADLVRELAHDDSSGARDVLAISDEMIAGWFRTRNVNLILTEDSVKAGTYGTGSNALLNQFFGLMAGGAPEPQWPNQSADGTIQLAWLLFPTGTYQFLDGGRLDLGVVRDSTLDATNDYELFVETFESVAMRGLEAYQVQSVVQPSGVSAAGGTPTYHE